MANFPFILLLINKGGILLIEFKQVSKIFPNGTRGLNNINLQIEQGEFVVIVGLSGAGKSTLLRSVNQLHDITEGEIIVNGKEITHAKGNELYNIRRDVGMIFQNFNLIHRSSVMRNVLSGRVGYHSTLRMILGLFPQKDKQIAYKALERVGLTEKAYVRADQLSGGQQQRVSIARALAQEAKVILADEPVASLDPLTTKKVMDDLAYINKELNITMVVNLHSVELAKEYGSRIIGLRAGEVVFDDPVVEATDDMFTEIYTETNTEVEKKVKPSVVNLKVGITK